MYKKAISRDMARATTLVKHMKRDKNTKTFVDCWWNRMIRKYIKRTLGVESEEVALYMLEIELIKRLTSITK